MGLYWTLLVVTLEVTVNSEYLYERQGFFLCVSLKKCSCGPKWKLALFWLSVRFFFAVHALDL